MEYALMIISIPVLTVQTICFREFNRFFMKNLSSYLLYNFFYFTVVTAVFIALHTGPSAMHASTAIMAVVYGMLFVGVMLFYVKAMETGPLAYTSLLFSFGLLVPIISGIFFWKENIGILQAVGLLLLFLTFYIGSGARAGKLNKINSNWLLFIIVALIGNGCLMTLAKTHQMMMRGKEIKEFLILAFAGASLLSLLIFLFRIFKYKETVVHLKNPIFVLLVFLTGITTAFGNLISLYLSGKIPAVILFPTVNGGIVILISMVSVVIFREKPAYKGFMGIILGLGSLVLLSVR